jgi:hypothetical protein
MGRQFLGIVLVALGVLLLAPQVFPQLDIGGLIGKLWPLIFVVMGLGELGRPKRNEVLGFGLIAVGAIWTLSNLEVLDLRGVGQYWPLLLIAAGLLMLLTRGAKAKQ